MALIPWMRWLFEIQIDQTKLLQPWCEHQLWFLCCALLCLVPWSTYGFADPVSNILGLPKFLVFPKSCLLHVVQIYSTFLHQTAARKSLALLSLELHSYIMLRWPLSQEARIWVLLIAVRKMSSVKVTLWHSLAYLNTTNFMLNIHRA